MTKKKSSGWRNLTPTFLRPLNSTDTTVTPNNINHSSGFFKTLLPLFSTRSRFFLNVFHLLSGPGRFWQVLSGGRLRLVGITPGFPPPHVGWDGWIYFRGFSDVSTTSRDSCWGGGRELDFEQRRWWQDINKRRNVAMQHPTFRPLNSTDSNVQGRSYLCKFDANSMQIYAAFISPFLVQRSIFPIISHPCACFCPFWLFYAIIGHGFHIPRILARSLSILVDPWRLRWGVSSGFLVATVKSQKALLWLCPRAGAAKGSLANPAGILRGSLRQAWT